MKPRLVARLPGVAALILVGALAFGLGGWLAFRSREADAPENRPATTDAASRLRARHVAARKARNRYELARLIREMAESAERRYIEVTCPRELAGIEREIRTAVLDLARTEDALEMNKYKQRFRPFPEPSGFMDLEFKKAEFTLQQALDKRKVLLDYTDPKTRREFKDVIEKLWANEIDRERAWEREEAREVELARRLDPI